MPGSLTGRGEEGIVFMGTVMDSDTLYGERQQELAHTDVICDQFHIPLSASPSCETSSSSGSPTLHYSITLSLYCSSTWILSLTGGKLHFHPASDAAVSSSVYQQITSPSLPASRLPVNS
ncbi:unnamed protein product [Pleuronectes platessa]|uniref:Uncharacterized protein n=1 Tax=Pleuronectes platessa TaxID=8262 RepID=A0A9N7UZ26_PLEPL|nr:unnamed protein product [Pleuronectes platessa]